MTFSLLSWNIMGKQPLKSRLLRRVAQYLELHGTDIICLQENPHGRKFFDLTKFKQHYIATTKRARSFLYSGSSIVSKFPIINEGEIKFSKRYDKKKRGMLNTRDRHDCVWADIDIGDTVLRIYNCHLKVISATARDRLRAIEKVYQHSREIVSPVVVCGDMNTVLSHPNGIVRKIIRWFNEIDETYLRGKLNLTDERQVFKDKAAQYSFKGVLDINKPTFAVPYTSVELFKLKLDWMLIRNINHVKVELGPYISDHRPILANLEV